MLSGLSVKPRVRDAPQSAFIRRWVEAAHSATVKLLSTQHLALSTLVVGEAFYGGDHIVGVGQDGFLEGRSIRNVGVGRG